MSDLTYKTDEFQLRAGRHVSMWWDSRCSDAGPVQWADDLPCPVALPAVIAPYSTSKLIFQRACGSSEDSLNLKHEARSIPQDTYAWFYYSPLVFGVLRIEYVPITWRDHERRWCGVVVERTWDCFWEIKTFPLNGSSRNLSAVCFVLAQAMREAHQRMLRGVGAPEYSWYPPGFQQAPKWMSVLQEIREYTFGSETLCFSEYAYIVYDRLMEFLSLQVAFAGYQGWSFETESDLICCTTWPSFCEEVEKVARALWPGETKVGYPDGFGIAILDDFCRSNKTWRRFQKILT